MSDKYIIGDASVTIMNALHPHNRLYYISDKNWSRDIAKATTYDSLSAAQEVADTLRTEAPVNVLKIKNV